MSSMPAIGLSPRQQKQRRRMSDAKHRASVAASYKQLQKVLPSTYDYHGVKEISRQTKIVRAAVSHINKLEETLDKILKLRAYKFGDRAGYSKTLYMIRRQFREQFLYNEAIQAQREKKTKKRVYQRKKKLVSVAELPTCPSVAESPSPQIVPSKVHVHPMTSTSTGTVHLVDVGVKVPSQLSSSMPNQVKYNTEVRPHSFGKEGPKTPYHRENLSTEPTFASTSQETTMSDIAKTTSTIGGTCTTEYNHPNMDEMKPSGTPEVEDATGLETDPRNRLFVTSTPKMLMRPAAFSSPDPVRSYREFEGYLLFYEHMVNQLQEQLQLPTQHLHSMQMSTTIQEIWKELPVACRRAITSTATSEVPKAAKLSRMKAVVSVSMDRASLQRMKSKEHACGERLSTSRVKACSKKTACIKLASPLPCEADFHKFLEQQGIELAQMVQDTSPTHVEGDYLDWSDDDEEEDENEYVVFLDDKMGFGNPKDPQTSLMHCDAEVPTFHKPDIQEKKEHSTQVVPIADTSIKREPSDIDDGTLTTNANGLLGREDTSERLLAGRNVKREPMWNGSSVGEEALPNCPVTPVFGAVSPATGFRAPVLKNKSLAKLPVDGTHIWTVDADERSLDLDKIFTKGGRSKTAMLPQQQDFLCSPTYQSLLSSGFLPRPPTTPDSSHQVVPDLGSPGDMLTDTDGYGEFWSPEESLFSLGKSMEPLSEMDQSNTSHSLECEEDSRDLDDDDL
ncbi:STRA8 [Branchiostoma lanceolatum]|uniref:STRA8 protein n=1 Tax=Branchiostoma lanceolatum TaxID=7740 RepID=A0A8J9ZM41_BRALA|nr:STRA8 [Branchiostoma lanceolatum]